MIHIPVLDLNINGQLQCVMNKVEPSTSCSCLARAESKSNACVGRNFLVSKCDTTNMSAIKKACLTKFTHSAWQG